MVTGARKDPYLGFNFRVEIQGLTVGGFSEVAGLQSEIEVQEYREGGLNGYVHKLAGPAKYPANLTLKRGIADNDTLWDWYAAVAKGNIQRQNGSIVLLDSRGEPIKRWNFTAAYPVKWSGPDLQATSGEIAVESLELAHQGVALAR